MQKNVIEYLEYGSLLHFPDKVAVTDNETEFTFSQLHDLSERLATHIASISQETRRPIAVFLPKTALTVIANLAIVKSANFYTNLDEKSPPERLEKLLTNVSPLLIFTNRLLMPSLTAVGVAESQIICLD